MTSRYGSVTRKKLKDAAQLALSKAGQHFLLLLLLPVRAIAPMAGARVSHSAIVTTIDVR